MFGPSMTAAYAIQALISLARRGGSTRGVDALAFETGVSRPYLVKILHDLKRQGLIATRRGNRGGYRLARDAADISLHDIVVAVDGPDVFERCLLGLGRCSPKRGCPFHTEWSPQRVGIRKRFRAFTLDRLTVRDRLNIERDYRFGLPGETTARTKGPGQ